MKFRTITCVFVLMLHLNCSKNTSESDDQYINVEVPRFSEMVDHDWFSKLHYIPLCTGNANIQIHDLAKVRYYNDHIYILDINQGIERQILKFDMDGTLIAKVPSENDLRLKSARIEDILIANDTLYAVNGGRGAIYRYDTDLKYVDMVSYPDSLTVRNIGYHPKSAGFAFRTSEPFGSVSPVYVSKNIQQFTGAFANELSSYAEIAAINFPFMFFDNFAEYEGDLLYYDLFSTAIWRYDGYHFKQAYKLHFADQLFITDVDIIRLPPDNVERQFEIIMQSNKAFKIEHIGQIDEYLLVVIGHPGRFYLIVFDSTGAVLRQGYVPILSNNRNTIDLGPDLDFPLGALGNKVVFGQEIEMIKLYNNENINKMTGKSNIEKLTELEDLTCNKVLVFATLKAMD